MNIYRIRNLWVQERQRELQAGPEQPAFTNSRINTSYKLNCSYSHDSRPDSRNRVVVCKTTSLCMNSSTRFAAAWTFNSQQQFCSSMNFQSRVCNQDLGFFWCSLTERSDFSVMFSDASGGCNGVILCFETNPESIYSIMMVTSVFCGIVENARSQRAFDTVIISHHFKRRYSLRSKKHVDHILFTLIYFALWTVVSTFLFC